MTTRDFASVLGKLLNEPAPRRVELARTPSLQVDLLEQIERLQTAGGASRPGTIPDYDLSALAPAARAALDELLPDLPTDLVAIERELALRPGMSAAELDRRRRDFAFANHPDRLAPRLRETALLRMQVANMLIDRAKDNL